MEKTNRNITIIYPGGNTTAIVEGIPSLQAQRKRINDEIMRQYPEVEQVGFLDRSKPYLQMAGSEFCGNATRSAASLLLKNRPGVIDICVSGTDQILRAWVDKKENVWTQMPLPSKLQIKTRNKFQVVKLEGITQVVTPLPSPKNSTERLKQLGFSILKRLNLTTSVRASGVVYVSKDDNGVVKIDPIVWVRDIKTLFYETSCSSGTTAVFIIEFLKQSKRNLEIPVLQPSGEMLIAQVKRSNQKISVQIGGKVRIFS